MAQSGWDLLRRARLLAGALAAAAILAAAWPLGQAQTPYVFTPGEENPEDFPPGRGREEAFYSCVACHNFKLVAAQGMSRARWDETITIMIDRHNMPEIGSADRELVLDYLAAAFPERPRRGWQNPFTR